MTTRLFTCLVAAAALSAAVPVCAADPGETEPVGQDQLLEQAAIRAREGATGLKEGESLLKMVNEGIQEGRRRIRETENSLYLMARQLDLDPEIDLRSLYESMKVERKGLFLERVLQDFRLASRAVLRRIYSSARDHEMDGSERDTILQRVDQLYLTYYERRLARVEARWALANAITDEERKTAEERLTLRDQQVEEVRSELTLLLHDHRLMEPGEELP